MPSRAERDAVVLLGHTSDDQAETVLLGLARGSGVRSLAGMPRRRGRFRRPLLELPRGHHRAGLRRARVGRLGGPAQLRSRRFSRVRVRRRVLPVLEAELGPGDRCCFGADRLAGPRRCGRARRLGRASLRPKSATPTARSTCARLADEPAAIRRRVIKLAAEARRELGPPTSAPITSSPSTGS